MGILGTVGTYVIGAVIREAQEIRVQRDQERAEADLTPKRSAPSTSASMNGSEASGRYPRITRLMETGLDPDDPETRDERFEFGLDCLLDGIAARIPASPASPAGPGPSAMRS